MANKEPKNIARFPRRLLSSFRRGKKPNAQSGKNDCTRPSAETIGFTQDYLETAQNENAIIDHEATLMLDSPRKKDPVESHNINAETPKRNLRRVIDEDHHIAFDATPRAQRFILGGPMSASADSGIDCSILLSEKSSPEQFVAFTRREAERLRQEHLHNGSVLETLDEVDRSTGEGTDNMTEVFDTTNELGFGDTEKVNEVSTDAENKVLAYTKNYSQSEGAVGYCDKGDTIPFQLDSTCDTLPSAYGGRGSFNSAKINSCTEETKDNFSSTDGDYVLLTENSDVKAQLVDATLYISSNKTCSVNKPEANRDCGYVNEPIDRVDDNNRLENEVVSEIITDVQLTENEGDINYLDVYANRTDEIKSAEARLRHVSSPEVELNLELTYDIVNPIPVSSASIATHRVIPSTPSPARLYINENSAFAKCKSLKRSVSDVSKGILGRLRHRSKDGAEYDCRSGKVQETYKKKSGLTKIKKFGVKKEKLGTKLKLYEENDKSGVRHESEQAARSTKYSSNMEENYAIVNLNNSVSTKSPTLTELVFEQEKMKLKKSQDDFVAKQSPVYKEILSGSVKLELEASFQEQHLPVMTESIQDITAGISEMTTALCASSAESIACICDCKNRYSGPECCEKRKTPSPLLSNECIENNITPTSVQNDNKRNSHFELYVAVSQAKDQESIESQQCEINQGHTIENEINEYSPMLCKNTSVFQMHENQYAQSQNCVGGEEHNESSDENYSNYYEDDNDTTSSDDCLDLDCSNCCNASPNTGVLDFSSSSSDSECSFSCSYENSVLNKDLNHKRDSESSSQCSWSSQNPELVSCSSCYETSSSSPQEECSFNIEGSPYSVSFKEIDFENGDVMYLANNLSDELEKSWINDSRDREKLSAVCATPVSSPRVYDNLSIESSPLTVNHSDSIVSDSSQNSHYQNQPLEEEITDCSMSEPASWSEANRSILGQVESPSQNLLVPPNAEQTAGVLHQTQDSSFTNVSFDGSFTDASFSVHKNRASGFTRTVLNEQKDSERKYFSCSQLKILNNSLSLNESLCDMNDSSFIGNSVRSLSHLNDSQLLQRTLPQNPNLRVNTNNSIMLGKSEQNVNHSFSTLDSSCFRDSSFHCNASGNGLNRSWSGSVDKIDSRNTSLYETSPSCPLDLSLNKGRCTGRESCVSKKSDREWVNRHLGQMYSPAKRVLQKNRGLSETDLCKQILDLYVSDADESGFEVADNEISLNSSYTGNTSLCGDMSCTILDDTESDEEKLPLQYGTYVAPRNVVKETNVDDFTTTTVWTCYTGEAKTRKLPGEDRQRTDHDELQSMCLDKRPSKKISSGKERFCPTRQLKDDTSARRVALRDRTNTTGRLSSSEISSERSFDRLTKLHTVHNGQRKVRCLSMDESQNVVKYYPPPKEATRVSWGQTISEMDLYRHTPRKTPVKTRPILNQKENNYPYEDDSPSPIVLTKMRKPKSLAKKYKNWPWS